LLDGQSYGGWNRGSMVSLGYEGGVLEGVLEHRGDETGEEWGREL
jgi:hypothetical protein